MKIFLLSLFTIIIFLFNVSSVTAQTSNENCTALGYGKAEGSDICVICPLGYYGLHGTCWTCPDNPRVSCSQGKIQSKKGIWVWYPQPELNQSAIVYRCASEYCLANSKCAKNRQGILCGECAPGYFAVGWLGTPCHRCTGYILLIILWALLAWALVILIQAAESNPNSGLGIKLRIILFYFQVVPLVFGPDSGVSQIMQQFNWSIGIGSIFGTCFSKLSFYQNFWIQVFVTFAIFGFLPINYVLHFVYRLLRNCCFSERQWPRFSNYINTAIALVVHTYISLTMSALSFLPCRQVDGQKYLGFDTSVLCSGTQYTRMIPLFSALLIYIVGVMIAVVVLTIWWKLRGMYNSPDSVVWFQILYHPFRAHTLWWSSYDFLRRISLCLCYVFGFYSNDVRTYSLLLCVTLILMIHILFFPFKLRIYNRFETTFLFSLLIIAATQGSSMINLRPVFPRIIMGLTFGCSIILFIICMTWDWALGICRKFVPIIDHDGFTKFVNWLDSKLNKDTKHLADFVADEEKRKKRIRKKRRSTEAVVVHKAGGEQVQGLGTALVMKDYSNGQDSLP